MEREIRNYEESSDKKEKPLEEIQELSGWEHWTFFLLYIPVLYFLFQPLIIKYFFKTTILSGWEVWTMKNYWLSVVISFITSLPAIFLTENERSKTPNVNLHKFCLRYIQACMLVVIPLSLLAIWVMFNYFVSQLSATSTIIILLMLIVWKLYKK